MSEKIWYLKRCDLFARLPPQRLRRLESRCRTRHFPRNSVIYAPRDESRGVLLVASGLVKICTLTEQGKEAILAFIEPGELFGELAVIEPGDREEYAEACQDSDVILIPADELRRLMDEKQEFSLGITKLIGLHRRRLERRLKHLLFRSNRERLVHALLDLAEQYGYSENGRIRLRIRLSHQDLANMIGSTREAVTLALGELQAEGILEVGRRLIVLTAPDRLAQSVHAPPPRIGETGQSDTAESQ